MHRCRKRTRCSLKCPVQLHLQVLLRQRNLNAIILREFLEQMNSLMELNDPRNPLSGIQKERRETHPIP